MWRLMYRLLIAASMCMVVTTAQAEEAMTSALAANTVWVVVSAALVFFMQAGFALLESGMSRAKNSVNVMMKNYTLLDE